MGGAFRSWAGGSGRGRAEAAAVFRRGCAEGFDESLCRIPGRISARRLVRAIARRRSARVAESRGRFGNAASVRARRRAPGRGCDTGSQARRMASGVP
ncbi:hypothetical protein F3K43_05915 [Streptomyces sp. LBUM 1476]|nr:hypothetical protein [Streptomyces sp. LBUM 1476]